METGLTVAVRFAFEPHGVFALLGGVRLTLLRVISNLITVNYLVAIFAFRCCSRKKATRSYFFDKSCRRRGETLD